MIYENGIIIINKAMSKIVVGTRIIESGLSVAIREQLLINSE